MNTSTGNQATPSAAAVQSALGAPASLSVKVQGSAGLVQGTATIKHGQGYQPLADAPITARPRHTASTGDQPSDFVWWP